MQVRYQAAPRPDRAINDTAIRGQLPPQNFEQLLELQAHLFHDLLALADVHAGLFATQLLTRATDREALLVQEAPDLADDNHVLALVITPVAAPFDRLELWKLLLPVAQHVRFDAAQVTDFTDREVAFTGYRR